MTYVITGEALLNDGTALVLYTLFYQLVQDGQSLSVGEIIIYAIRVIFISPLIGFAVGFVSIIVIGLADKKGFEEDVTIQLGITFCCAYFSFYIAQRVLGVSGVIACCTAGVLLSRYAVPRYLKLETIESVWSAVEWIGNTLLFFLAGLLIGNVVGGKITGGEIVYIFVMFLFLTVLRYVTIILLYPALSRSGKGCSSFAEAIFVGWSGLRGAVGIALAISFYDNTLQGNTTVSDDHARSLLFLVGGVATLTLLVNATASEWILKKFQLLEDDGFAPKPHSLEKNASKEESLTLSAQNHRADDQNEMKFIFEYLKKRVRLRIYQVLESSQNHFLDEFLDLSFLFKHCTMLKYSPEAKLVPRTESAGDEDEKVPGQSAVENILHEQEIGAKAHEIELGEINRNANYNSDKVRRNSQRKSFHAALSHSDLEGADHDITSSYENVIAGKFERIHIRTTSDAPARRSSYADEFVPDPDFGLQKTHSTSKINTVDGKRAADISPSKNPFKLEINLENVATSPKVSMARSSDRTISGGTSPIRSAISRTEIFQSLLNTMRKVFLDVLRVHYFKQIHNELLPRQSYAAILLLNSIDVSLYEIKFQVDSMSKNVESSAHPAHPSLNDLAVLIKSHFYLRKMSIKSEAAKKRHSQQAPLVNEGERKESTDREGIKIEHASTRAPSHYSIHLQTTVMMLISYIEAHEYAQNQISFYLGETEGAIDTPEEEAVIQESQALVQKAKEILAIVDESTINYIYSKRILYSIFSIQQNSILEFEHEGIINKKYVEYFFHEIEEDINRMKQLERKKLLTVPSSVNQNQMDSSFSISYLVINYKFFFQYWFEYYFEEVVNWYYAWYEVYQKKF